jgi:hypothetical protein
MPPSNDADRLVKAIHPFLSSKIPSSRLRSLGWFDFLNNDRPDTSDPIVMATAAFLYLSLEESGGWNGETHVIVGMVGFLKSRTSKTPTATDLSDLKAHLQRTTVDPTAIELWFQQVYR